jgi:hypothetical protein
VLRFPPLRQAANRWLQLKPKSELKIKLKMKKIKILLFISLNLILACSDDNEQTIETTVVISDFTLTIDENPVANQSLGTVDASTNQGSLTFSIQEQTPNNAIEIDSSTGEITVLNGSLFDFETNPTITGIVKVENGNIFNTANITINLNDVNELNLQNRLDNGETPCEIYQSDNSLLEDLYGLSYQGGLIFYLNTVDCSGMISAPFDQSDNDAQWGCYQTYISAATNSSIGSGLSNTNAILASCSDTGIASRICADLVLNSYNDWYLPSKDELNLLYINLHLNGFGDFENGEGNCCNGWYWSSTDGETNGEAAWVQSFRNGQDGFQATYDIGIKNFENHVRAIRNF